MSEVPLFGEAYEPTGYLRDSARVIHVVARSTALHHATEKYPNI